MQEVLLDRRQVYARLQAAGITVPTHVIINREGLPPGADPPGFEETEDFVAMGGTRIYKPFVEKPSNADDHNIYIYYPHSMGGGVKRLFRKVRRRRGRARGEEMGVRGGMLERPALFFSC
jgi:inositol-hexakisphosphate/diphosphoinositol-pentakisphosphate 1-kinase